MRMTAVAGLVLVAALVAPMFAAPAHAQSLVGDWMAKAAAPSGEVVEKLTVVKTATGFAITVKMVNPPDGALEAGPGFDIVLDGDKFSYKRTVDTPQGPFVINYWGTVSGDTFSGTVDLGGLAQAPYTGVREEAPAKDSRSSAGTPHGR